MYGLIVRFDLRPEAVDDFDRLVERTLTAIREHEDGTLLYVSSRVEDAPCARIFVELYADEAAFAAHEEAPHTRAFLAEREAMIESLRVEVISPVEGASPQWPR